MRMRDEELELVVPTLELKDAALEYKEEHFNHGDTQVHGSGGLAYFDDYGEWLKHVEEIRNRDGVVTSTFFCRRVSDGKLIGCVKIHHSLNDELRAGGHIAYGIRPSERGKGYGEGQLRLALKFAESVGLKQVIVACDKDNVASAGTALSCGGVLTAEFIEEVVVKQHYCFEL